MANSTNKPSSGGRKAAGATTNSGGNMEQQRNNDVANGVFSFHSVKRFGGGTPILLLSSAGTSSHHENRSSIGRHFIVQTTTSNNQHGGVNSGAPTSSSSCLNPRTTARLKVQMAQHQQQQMKTENGSGQQQQMQVHQDSVRSNSQTPIGSDGEPIKLPENLESLPRSDHFPNQRHRWNTNEEIAGILISFDRHTEWQSKEVKIRPKSGSMLLYSRKKVRYRRDGYCWKKRKDGKTTREDHMKLKVQGTECIYGCYVHSAILPTFHRRCYWLLQNPDIVLVHYLNVPYPDDTKMAVITPSLALWTDKKEWTKDELVSQLKPMFFSEDEPDLNNELEISTAETVDAIVSQLMEKQRVARQAALVKQLECGCPDSTCADGKTCSHPMRRITAAAAPTKATDMSINVNGSSTSTTTTTAAAAVASNSRLVGDGGARPPSRTESSNNQVSSTTGSSPIQLNTSQQQQLLHHHSTQQQQQQQQQPRVYTRTDRVVHHHHHHNNNNNNSNTTQTQYVHIAATSNNASSNNASSSNNTTPPLVLSLSQIQNGNAGLIILNSGKGNGEMGFVCNGRKEDFYSSSSKEILNMHQQNQLKQEAMDTTTNPSSSLSLYANLTTIISNDNQKQTTTLLNHTDGFMPRQRHYQSEVTRSVTPSMSSKLNHDDVSNNSSSSSSNNIFLDQHNKLTMTMTNQQQQQQLFFNNHETLDLSQEDIQRTLSANMPMSVAGDVLEEAVANSGVAAVVVGCRREEATKEGAPVGEGSLMVVRGVEMTYSDISKRQHHHHQQVLSPEISTMDFIDPCDDVPSSPNVVDDDVFVNLDAFDMLGEFPDLEVLDPVGHSTLLEASLSASNATSDHPTSPTDNQQHSNSTTADQLAISNDQQQSSTPANTDDAIVKITDYSPEWAYPDGGVKVLVTGPWHLNRSGGYTVLFDAFPVPTTLVQSGVLRCYCPAHEAGLATLQVACDGYVISNSVIFEYKLPAKEEHAIYALEPKVERSNDNLLKFTLLQRLEAMDERLQIKKEPVDSCDLVEDSVLFSKPNLEDRLVSYCQRLTGRLWRHGEELSVDWFASHRGMTLLHLAASLGYSRLVCAILHWRAENSSLLLETEVDALSQDEYGYTPLMWACVKGHTDTAVMLYKWNHTALNIPNHLGQSALECAKMNGFNGLGKSLERLENKREKANQMLLNSCLTSKLEGGGESLTTNVGGKLCRAVSSSSSGTMSPAGSVTSVASTSRSHDGVFLRPGAVTTRFVDTSAAAHPKYKSTLNLDSLDSFTPHTTSCASSDSSSIVKHLLLSSAPSPLLSATTNNPNNRGSCFGQRLSKRTSFDSGIHLNQSAENVVVGNTKAGARGQPIVTGARNMLGSDKVTRFTRSMSLPLQHSTLSQEVEQSFNNCGDGLKKMDFALCEVVTLTQSKRGGQNSPLIDVEAVSSEDDDDEENDLAACVADDDAATAAAAVNAVSGDQDVRVLTLAEQIIAAIPDRIKNESEDMLLDSPSSVAMLHSNDLLSDVLMEPLFDQSSSSFESSDVFELSDYNYRYYDVATPCSSLSPAPSSCLQSPRSFTLDSPSPPPTTADFCEFFQASGGIFENDFSNLTLSDREQRELYEAAKIIQKAYRSYKGRQQQEQNKERAAAILIQNYYRRYKQYAYFKQMTHAAMVIQNGFRSYCEHKRFKKSKEAALCIQNYYRNYKEQGNTAQCTSNRDKNLISDNMSSNSSGSTGLKRTYSQRRQHQAARKIQQFMRQSKNKLQRERAEKEKQLDQSAAVHPLQRLLCPEDNSI